MHKNPPFFILANPRSGSSLLRIICDSHSHITVPPESGFMEWWHKVYGDWSAQDSKNPAKVNAFIKHLISSKKFETWHFDSAVLVAQIEQENPTSYSELCALVYRSYGKQKGKIPTLWGDKNNYYIEKTALLHALYPSAKYIHLVRDGRDVATSYVALKDLRTQSQYAPKLTANIVEIAQEWDHNNRKLDAFFDGVGRENVLLLRYEDLVSDLKKTCHTITTFLGVPMDKRMLTYDSINREESLEPEETLDWKKKTLEKPDTSNIGKYKKLLSEEEISTFNAIAAISLKKYQYES